MMNKGKLLSLALVLAVGLMLGIGPVEVGVGSGSPGTWTVCAQGCNFTKIQEAIDGASPGDTVEVKAGEYQENLVIKKSLTLRGMGAEETIIDGIQEGYPVVWIMMQEEAQMVLVKVKGLMVTGAQGEDCADLDKAICPNGVLIQGSAQAEITGCTISENQWNGIMLQDSTQAEITNSTISGNERDGIMLYDSAQATIERNTITKNLGYGVALYQQPCYDTDEVFFGLISGKGNTIPGLGEPDGNDKGNLCPDCTPGSEGCLWPEGFLKEGE